MATYIKAVYKDGAVDFYDLNYDVVRVRTHDEVIQILSNNLHSDVMTTITLPAMDIDHIINSDKDILFPEVQQFNGVITTFVPTKIGGTD